MWISVKDKLPALDNFSKTSEDVLMTDGEYIKIGVLEKIDGKLEWHDSEYYRMGVTHWQPLPPLPQEENQGELLDKIYTEDDL